MVENSPVEISAGHFFFLAEKLGGNRFEFGWCDFSWTLKILSPMSRNSIIEKYLVGFFRMSVLKYGSSEELLSILIQLIWVTAGDDY